MSAKTKDKKTDRVALDPNDFRFLGSYSWADFADGDVYRLKHGKHYRGNLNAAKKAGNEAAAELNKSLKLVRDPLGKLQYIWVQFADGDVTMGDPCPCGSRRLFRVHETYLRCPECKRLLSARPPAPGESGSVARAGTQLSDFTDVTLSPWKSLPGKELHRGHGINSQGHRVLLIVRYPLSADGSRIEDPDAPGEYRHSLSALAAEPFGDAINLDAL